MAAIEMLVFILSVTLPISLIVAFAWYRRWKRDPKEFKRGFREGPHYGGPMGRSK
jgi:hypothetical protein